MTTLVDAMCQISIQITNLESNTVVPCIDCPMASQNICQLRQSCYPTVNAVIWP